MKLYIQVMLVCGVVAMMTVGQGESCSVIKCMRQMISCKREANADGNKDYSFCCSAYKACYQECKPGYEPKCMESKRGSWNKRMESYLERAPVMEDPYFL